MRKISIIPLHTNTCKMVQSFDIIVPLMNQTTMQRNHSNEFRRNFVSESEEWEQADSRYSEKNIGRDVKKAKRETKTWRFFVHWIISQKKGKQKSH